MHIAHIWRRITTTRDARALEAELARQRAHATEQGIEIARLRAENRALLNSILGIAGIPPLPAAEADLAAIHASLYIAPSDLPVGARHAVPERASGTHAPSTHYPTNPALECAAYTTADSATSPSPSAGRGSAVPLRADDTDSANILAPTPNRSALPDGLKPVPPRRSAPHAAAPMRRRSWPQIHRLLEFESAQKDKPAAEPLPPARQ
jgi:hypothetical protein